MDNKDNLDYEDIKHLIMKFKRLSHSMHSLMDKCIEDNISSEQIHLLFVITHLDGVNQKELAKKMHITPATLSVRIKRLESLNLITREVAKDDKRNFIIKATAEAKQQVEEAMVNMQEGTIRMFAGFSQEDITIMTGFIEKFGDNISKMKEELDAQD